MSRFSRIFRQFCQYSFPASFAMYSTSTLHTIPSAQSTANPHLEDHQHKAKPDDDEECETPICHDANEAVKEYSHLFGKSGGGARRSGAKRSFMAPPPDRQQLGRHSWTLLHTMAAYWPQHPSEQQKEDMIQFFHLLSQLYPCHVCAADLRHELEQYPPNVESRDEFIEWLCKLHNRISKKIHKKQQFDCSKHQTRWRREKDYTWHDIEELEED
eukprot:CAMPEP_0197055808 /NCGR_PEP_ID=MMETSP1384-20130603/74012_1 /TAXON_ID=29189 /ORGANISM="Ammonia sp." /LENGTH=213 /DNA_ID=CAMNT_0042489527 /DNA_START=31 /DNA_END=672 /DNA_ORIENTATION=-